MQRALSVLVNEYAVTDSRSENPRALTLGVVSCVGIGFMLQNRFNTAATGHFFCHAQTLDDARAEFKKYVDDGIRRMLADIGWEKGMPIRAGIVGGLEGWGDDRQSELLVEFVHAALKDIEGLEIVFDHTPGNRNEDIVVDSVAGTIRPLFDSELEQTILDSKDTQAWSLNGPAHLERLNAIHEGVDNPAGTRLARHPQSVVAP